MVLDILLTIGTSLAVTVFFQFYFEKQKRKEENKLNVKDDKRI